MWMFTVKWGHLLHLLYVQMDWIMQKSINNAHMSDDKLLKVGILNKWF